MWKVSPKTPHTQFLCRVHFHKLALKTHRGAEFHNEIPKIAEFFTESATNNVSKMPSFIKIHPRRPEISSILYQKTCQDD
jgi:hypothetical protein